jgi:hypothetical protein
VAEQLRAAGQAVFVPVDVTVEADAAAIAE